MLSFTGVLGGTFVLLDAVVASSVRISVLRRSRLHKRFKLVDHFYEFSH